MPKDVCQYDEAMPAGYVWYSQKLDWAYKCFRQWVPRTTCFWADNDAEKIRVRLLAGTMHQNLFTNYHSTYTKVLFGAYLRSKVHCNFKVTMNDASQKVVRFGRRKGPDLSRLSNQPVSWKKTCRMLDVTALVDPAAGLRGGGSLARGPSLGYPQN